LTAFLTAPRAARAGAPLRWVIERMKHYGSIDYAQEVANGLAGAALHEFSTLFDSLPDSRDKTFLADLATWVLERDS
ncbi:MAG: polyprenyl synthetase family protein, partial [Acidobacteriota bacterium]|nr:polyprenyl synthetase family protein [Acidobacteriota bacterium]